MTRPRRLVVQSRPRYQRSVPSPFGRQRGGWISASVPKPPGYDLTKWLLARQRRGRAQRGGVYSIVSEEYPVREYQSAFMRRIKRRRR